MNYNEFNFNLEDLKIKIYKNINNSNLPLGAIFYIIKDLYNMLQTQYINSINSYTAQHPIEEGTKQVQQAEDMDRQSSEQ